MKKYNQEDILNIIKNSGLKYTEHRHNVLTRIAKSKTPIAVIQIIEDLKKKYNIDQATVYRNLSSLESAGLLRRYDYNHGHAHYELNTGEDTHQIVCNKCETIEKISGQNFDDIIKKIIKKSKKFKTTSRVNLEIYGECRTCK
jgi:Fur family transcriptional regulator, ferric uptake regulator